MKYYDYTPKHIAWKNSHRITVSQKAKPAGKRGDFSPRLSKPVTPVESLLRWLKTSENNFNGREKLRGELPFNSQPKETFLIDLAIPGMYDFVKLYCN